MTRISRRDSRHASTWIALLICSAGTASYGSTFPSAGIDAFASVSQLIIQPDAAPGVSFLTPFLSDSTTQIGRSDPFIVGSGNPAIDTGTTGLPSTAPTTFTYPTSGVPPFTNHMLLPTTGRRAINTEILSLDLTGSVSVAAGTPAAQLLGPGLHTFQFLAGLPFEQWTNGPGSGFGVAFHPSFGQVVSEDPTANPANDLTLTTDSFFNVFGVFLIDGAGTNYPLQVFANTNPLLPYNGCVLHLPPEAADDSSCDFQSVEGGGHYEEGQGRLQGYSSSGPTGGANTPASYHSGVLNRANADMDYRNQLMEKCQDIPGCAGNLIDLSTPEPSTFALLLGGTALLAGLIIFRKRRARS